MNSNKKNFLSMLVIFFVVFTATFSFAWGGGENEQVDYGDEGGEPGSNYYKVMDWEFDEGRSVVPLTLVDSFINMGVPLVTAMHDVTINKVTTMYTEFDNEWMLGVILYDSVFKDRAYFVMAAVNKEVFDFEGRRDTIKDMFHSIVYKIMMSKQMILTNYQPKAFFNYNFFALSSFFVNNDILTFDF